MSKNRLTLEQLIAAKSKKDKFAAKAVEIKSLGGSILIQKIPYDNILHAMDMIEKESSMSVMLDEFKELIYKSVPMFRNDELIKAYEVSEPLDIVTELLELGEIMDVGHQILTLYGFEGLEDEVKN